MPKSFSLKIEEINDVVANIFDKSKMDWRFYLLLVLSSAIVCLGLIVNNAAIVIGGMLVAPLLTPILALSLGVVVTNSSVIWRSSKILLKSIVIIFLVSAVSTLIVPQTEINTELISRTFISLPFFYVALASGIAAAFAWARPDLSESLPGIAISVALLPPLATSGIGLALWQPSLILGGLKLFIINLLGILIAAAFIFSIMGFFKAKKLALQMVKEEEKEVIKKELEKVKEEESLIEEVQKEVEVENNNNHEHIEKTDN